MVQSSTATRTMHHHHDTTSSSSSSSHNSYNNRGSHTSKQDAHSHRRETTSNSHSSSVEMDRYGNASTTSNSSAGSFDSMDSYDSSFDDQQQQSWMSFTIIEDDDLMFGGKPLCTWYEEDRRCSMGEESAPSPCSSINDDEEMHRGRQRDRPQYRTSKHKSEKKHH